MSVIILVMKNVSKKWIKIETSKAVMILIYVETQKIASLQEGTINCEF
jgi:hypothetical protein